MARSSASSKALTDHDEIRRWAEQRNASPSCVRNTGGSNDVGMIRLDFPGYSGEGSLEEISWDDWFQKFDESGLALLVQDRTASGQKSNFNKLVSRETAGVSGDGRSSSRSSSRTSRRGGKGSSAIEVVLEDKDLDEEDSEYGREGQGEGDIEEEMIEENEYEETGREPVQRNSSGGSTRSRSRQASAN